MLKGQCWGPMRCAQALPHQPGLAPRPVPPASLPPALHPSLSYQLVCFASNPPASFTLPLSPITFHLSPSLSEDQEDFPGRGCPSSWPHSTSSFLIDDLSSSENPPALKHALSHGAGLPTRDTPDQERPSVLRAVEAAGSAVCLTQMALKFTVAVLGETQSCASKGR